MIAGEGIEPPRQQAYEACELQPVLQPAMKNTCTGYVFIAPARTRTENSRLQVYSFAN